MSSEKLFSKQRNEEISLKIDEVLSMSEGESGNHPSRSKRLLNLILGPFQQVFLTLNNCRLPAGERKHHKLNLFVTEQIATTDDNLADSKYSKYDDDDGKVDDECSIDSQKTGSNDPAAGEHKRRVLWKKRSRIPTPSPVPREITHKLSLKKYIRPEAGSLVTPVAILSPVKKKKSRLEARSHSVRQLNISMNNKSVDAVTSDLSSSDSSHSDGHSSSTSVQPRQGNEICYYIGGSNNTALIEEILNGYGWRRTRSKGEENWKMKWCELKSSINYHAFKEGEQMVNHIPNCEMLTNKQGLLNSLQEYNRMSFLQKRFKIDFVPETYRLDEIKNREKFPTLLKDGDIWICKPTSRNQGKGIFLIRNIDDYVKALSNEMKMCDMKGRPIDRIVQRYISNPLLVNNRKFDIRAYMLIASTVPYLVLYHKGYIRMSMNKYSIDCDSMSTHLTNQYIQKKDPKYYSLKEETAWTMDRFNDYVNDNIVPSKKVERNWVFGPLTEKMHSIMRVCFDSVKGKLTRKLGYFELYGFDFIVDESMKVWLLEINVNPSLATNCEALKAVIPDVVREAIDISIECFEKSRKRQPIIPLTTLKTFEVLHTPIISTPTAFSNTYRRSSFKSNRQAIQQDNEASKDGKSAERSEINVNLSAKVKPLPSSSNEVITFTNLKTFTGQCLKKYISDMDSQASRIRGPAINGRRGPKRFDNGKQSSNILEKYKLYLKKMTIPHKVHLIAKLGDCHKVCKELKSKQDSNSIKCVGIFKYWQGIDGEAECDKGDKPNVLRLSVLE